MLYYIQHYFISKLKHVQLNFFLCTKIYFEGGGAKNISNQLTVLPFGLEGMDLSLAFMFFMFNVDVAAISLTLIQIYWIRT